MSIAVSALVRPSHTHRILLGACALLQCALAVALASGAPSPYLGGPLLGLVPALAAVFLLRAVARPVKAHRIDISGTGDLRVTVQQDVCADTATAMLLLPGSRIWPLVMVLRYGAPGGPPRVLVVWRDAVDGAAWRGLAVALGALGRRRTTAPLQGQIRKRGDTERGGPQEQASARPTEQTTGHVQ